MVISNEMVLKNDQGVLVIVDSTVFVVSYRNIEKNRGLQNNQHFTNEIRDNYNKIDNWSDKSFV